MTTAVMMPRQKVRQRRSAIPAGRDDQGEDEQDADDLARHRTEMASNHHEGDGNHRERKATGLSQPRLDAGEKQPPRKDGQRPETEQASAAITSICPLETPENISEKNGLICGKTLERVSRSVPTPSANERTMPMAMSLR